MDGDRALPPPPPPPARPSGPPRSDAVAPKRNPQRRLGLAPPPSNTGSGVGLAGQGRTTAGEDRAKGAPPLQGRKRPPRDPSSASRGRKAKKTVAAPPAPLHPTPFTSSIPGSAGASASTPDAPAVTASSSPASPAVDAQYVLDGMLESLDDETFFSILDGHTFGIDMNATIDDEDNDGVLPSTFHDDGILPSILNEDASDVDGDVPKKKDSRGVNFTSDEDETVVKAWQAVSLDSITGDEQARSTYWKHIYDHFHHNNKSGTFRSQASVAHRWHIIQVSCTKWSSCLVQVDRLNPSGANAQDKVNIAQRLYKGKPKKKGGKPGKAFALHHCGVLLEHDEKWRTRNEEVPTKSKKSSNSCSPHGDEDVDSDDENIDGRRSPTPSSVPSEKRPSGRKAEKEKLTKGGDSVYKESIDNMVASRKEIATDRKEFKVARWVQLKEMEERRTAAEERRAATEEQRAAVEERRLAAEEATKMLEQEQRIMFMDPSNLDDKGRAYLELMRDQVLASRSMPSSYMGGFMGRLGGFNGNGGNGSSTGNGDGVE